MTQTFENHGVHAATKTKTMADDNNWQIPAAELWSSGVENSGTRAVAVFVTVETNDARVAFGGADASAGTGHVFSSGDSFRITGHANISAMKIANATAGSNTKIIYTVEF